MELVIKMRRKNVFNGFTLAELVVVIAIIGILAVIIVPNIFKSIDKSKVSSVESDYKAIKNGALSYFFDVGSWPADGSGAAGFVTKPSGAAGWNGPYIQKWPAVNAFGGTYKYHYNAPVEGAGITATNRYITVTGIPDGGIIKLKNDIDSTTLSAISAPQTTGNVRYVDNSKIYIVLSTSTNTSTTKPMFTDKPISTDKPTPSTSNLLLNGDFSDGGTHWVTVPDAASGGSASGGSAGGEYKVSIANTGSLTYSVQLCQGGLNLTSGKTYRLTFDARSTIARIIQLHILNSSNYANYASKPVNIDGTMKSYSFDFGMSATNNNAILAIHLGATEALSAHDVYFDNIVLKEISTDSATTQAFLNNSDFNSSTSYWDTIVTPPADATYSIVNGEYKASITNVGTACYHVQLMQSIGAPLTAGKTYRLSIDARSTIKRSIELIIQNTSNYSYYYDQVIDIDGTMKTYTIDLPMSTTLSNITFVAGMGAVNGATDLPAHDVYIDNLEITEK